MNASEHWLAWGSVTVTVPLPSFRCAIQILRFTTRHGLYSTCAQASRWTHADLNEASIPDRVYREVLESPCGLQTKRTLGIPVGAPIQPLCPWSGVQAKNHAFSHWKLGFRCTFTRWGIIQEMSCRDPVLVDLSSSSQGHNMLPYLKLVLSHVSGEILIFMHASMRIDLHPHVQRLCLVL